MTMIKDVTIELGPRDVVIKGKVVAAGIDITVDVAESTEEELAKLKEEPVILLVKPLPERIYKGAEHEG